MNHTSPGPTAILTALDDEPEIARYATGRRHTMPAGVALATMPAAPLLTLPGPLRRAAGVVGNLLGTLAVVVSVPLMILVVGLPIALCVRLLLWLGGGL